MSYLRSYSLDYDRPVKVGDGIYWVGSAETDHGWRPNPYCVVDQGEAVLIDAGSRAQFTSLILKIMQMGLPPSAIKALVNQSSDPRLSSGLGHLEALIHRKDLKVISHKAFLALGQQHLESSIPCSLEDVGHRLEFSSGRTLEFFQVPFACSSGSFVTFDRKSGVLFSGDLFSSQPVQGKGLFLELGMECRRCEGHPVCPRSEQECPVFAMLQFHRENFSSEKALQYALKRIASVPYQVLAPHQGSLISGAEDIAHLNFLLASLKEVGIDAFLRECSLCRMKSEPNENAKYPETDGRLFVA